MSTNLSPWIHQLKRTRELVTLTENKHTQIAVIGGGISGLMTAYFILTTTDKTILLVEGNKIAHGATGHNAGQLVTYFEKSFAELAKEFGVDLAAEGQSAVESSWGLLEELMRVAKLRTPLFQFTGYAGCKDYEEVLVHLEDNWWRVQGGLQPERLFVAKEAPYLSKIDPKYKGQYNIIPQKDILSLLETKETCYTATLAARKGCMNSALFCEELTEYLLRTFSTRFMVVEHTPVSKVVLYKDHAELLSGERVIFADRVVLCTNGFERFTIENKVGADIDTKFHHLVRGSVGYMAGYLAPLDKPPVAISYLPEHHDGAVSAFDSEPYFYLTRRPYEMEANERHNLICIGGPESLMDDTNKYHKEHPYPEEAQKAIDRFLHKTYNDAPKEIRYTFRWHGLMGYTPNGVRCVGFEPCNPVLLYNLGCNGIGIMPSVCSGKRIAALLSGESLAPSIFDPADQRCVLPKKVQATLGSARK